MKLGPHRGLLVAIEGIDGAGKTTQIRLVADRFRARGWEVVSSKEPTDGTWGKIIRRSATDGRLSHEQELHAFLEDRREHVAKVIRPALGQGKLVLLDRYYFSSIAYQGLHGRDPEYIRAANEAFAPRPDLLVVLDLDPEQALKRIERRGDEANHFERVHLLEASREIFWRYIHDDRRAAPDGRQCRSVKLDALDDPRRIAEKIEHGILQVAVEAIGDDRALSPADAVEATAAVYGAPVPA